MNFKPTYKTGGTTSRKPSKNDRAMVSGVSSILRKIKDKKNRKEVAGNMVKQFNREGVSYNKEKFLKNSRSFQDGGTLPPIYTSNPYDSRISDYNDSLNLYNYTLKTAKNNFTKVNIVDKNKWRGSSKTNYSKNFDIPARLSSIYIKPVQVAVEKNPDPYWMRVVGEPAGVYPIYKKPVQPIIYADPKIVEKQKLLKEARLYSGDLDGIWGDKSKEAWKKYEENKKTGSTTTTTSTSTTTPKTGSAPTTTSSTDERLDKNLYDPNKPWNRILLPKETKESTTPAAIPAEPYLIRPFNSLYGDDKIRAIVKYGDPSKVPTIGVDVLQLRREYPDVNKYRNTEKPKAAEVKKYGGSINKGAKLSKLYKAFKLKK